MKGWDSTRMIGKVKESYKNYLDRQTRLHDDPLWNAFYNGWLEGRGDMLMQIERVSILVFLDGALKDRIFSPFLT